MLLATALALLITGCINRHFIQNKWQRSSTKGSSPSFLRFWNWAKALSMQPKFVAAQKMLLNRSPANIRKWIAQFFITLKHYAPLEARVYATVHELPIDMGNSICTAH